MTISTAKIKSVLATAWSVNNKLVKDVEGCGRGLISGFYLDRLRRSTETQPGLSASGPETRNILNNKQQCYVDRDIRFQTIYNNEFTEYLTNIALNTSRLHL